MFLGDMLCLTHKISDRLLVTLVFRVPYNLILSVTRKKLQGESFVRCGILIFASILTIGYCVLLDKMAVARATPVADAITQYKLVTGNYPNRLDDLVPRYISQLPTSLKPTAMSATLTYSAYKGKPFLYFGPSPGPAPLPKIYNFDTHSWKTND
jgi:hypothetical protein